MNIESIRGKNLKRTFGSRASSRREMSCCGVKPGWERFSEG